MSDRTSLQTDLALVRAEIEGKEYEFEVKIGANLLGSALSSRVPVDRICRVGLCGACQVQVIKGREHLSAPTDRELLLLDRAPIELGVRLACQARVEGDLLFRHAKAKSS